MVGAKLADALGQPVVISNRGGAGGTIAAAHVAKSDPDGYTLLLNTIATHGIGPHIYANLPYDPTKDFAPVVLVAKLPLIMAVNADVAGAVGQRRDRAREGEAGRALVRLVRQRRRARISPASCSSR